MWLTNLATTDGVTSFFIPAFGYAIWIIATLMYLTWRVDWKTVDWGPRQLTIPMAVIVLSMAISGVVYGDGLGNKLAPFLFGGSLFALYLLSRRLGKGIFIAFVPFVVVVAISVIVSGVVNPGVATGGLISNYAASAGFLVFGTVVSRFKWQWVLATVAFIALFFVGTLEAVFAVGVLGVVVLVRRDVSRKVVAIAAVGVILIGGWWALGYLAPLYEGNYNLSALGEILSGEELSDAALDDITTDRWWGIVNAARNLNVIGHGYTMMTSPDSHMVHFVPMTIVDQIGPLAAVAWLWVTVWCFIKTKWKYAWIAVLAMSVFDHYVWTQFAPWWWVLVGVSAASMDGGSDRIFSKVEEDQDEL
ncbi:MAG: hypothetical protein ACUZ8A_06605 [Candidatus Bathyanammoxibius sp.]